MGKKKRKLVAAAGIIVCSILLALLFREKLASFIITLLLIVLASFSKMYKHITQFSIGFELITPITILFAYEKGIAFALVSNIFMLLAAGVLSGRLEINSIIAQGAVYLVTILLASFLSRVAFTPLAILLVIFQNAVGLPLDIFMTGRNFFHSLFIATFSTFVNIYIVMRFGELLLAWV